MRAVSRKIWDRCRVAGNDILMKSRLTVERADSDMQMGYQIVWSGRSKTNREIKNS